jgi:DNA-binding transcriptional regulator YdaS (Cro superfamily)
MTKEIAIQLAGSIKDLAHLLGISRHAIYQWKTIPEKRIWQLRMLKPDWFM